MIIILQLLVKKKLADEWNINCNLIDTPNTIDELVSQALQLNLLEKQDWTSKDVAKFKAAKSGVFISNTSKFN